VADGDTGKRKGGPLKLPAIDGAMNKTMPRGPSGGKGAKDDKDALALGEKKSKNDDTKLLERARKRMDQCISVESENRKAGLDDLKFKAGDQWPADVMAERNLDRRPCHTINKIKTFVHQITNDQRQNRPAIHISPVGDRGDPETAKMLYGLIRYIERDSGADIAYDTAFDGAVSNGFGYFRLATEFETPESFNQVLKIVRIRNPFTVYLDPNHQEPDGADCKYAFVTEMMPRHEFSERWPDADPIPWDKAGIGETLKNWVTQNELRVAEYFEIEYEKKTLIALSNGWTGWEEDIHDDVKSQIDSGAIEIEREREAERPKVKWYRLTAKEVLERNDWVGQWIPLFKVIGDEIDIEGKVKLAGIIRDMKSPQQMYNYWSTMMTELVALAPKAPFIMEEGQVEGHEGSWKTANTRSNPYLLYKAVNVNGTPAPPPQRQPAVQVPAGVQQALQNAQQDMMAVSGIRFDATVSERMYDESGKAINALQQRGDLTNFHYIDNLGRAMKHLGRCLIDAIPKVYDTRQVLTILREDDTEERVQLDPANMAPGQKIRDPSTGKTMNVFNPSAGKYGVTVTIGPSFATKRTEASAHMIEFAKAFPEFGAAIADLIAKNQDWPGGSEMATRLAKVVAQKFPGVMTPDMKDVPPQVQAMLASMDQQLKQMAVERQQLIMALNDKTADRAVDIDKINKDFEAKMTKIVADIETKTAATQEKVVGQIMTHAHAMNDLGVKVGELMHKISTADTADKGDQA
jgi:hypothetical protein